MSGLPVKKAGLIVAVEMFAVFEGWGQPDEIYEGRYFKLCRYDRYDMQIFVARSGPGQKNAEDAARMLIDDIGVAELWNFGVAGGLTEAAHVGDVFVVSEVIRWDGVCSSGVFEADGAERGRRCGCGARPEAFRVDAPAGAADVRQGVLASGDSVVSARGARLMLADITGADIVDMEGAGIAAAAASGSYPCFMVKCVSDGIDTDEAMLTADFRRTARRAFDAFDMILKKSQV